MTYVIAQNCCNDASCVAACPVGCIHPTPDEKGYATAEMLYIDPAACIDCGACVDVCPVDAVVPADQLTGSLLRFAEMNAQYYQANPVRHRPVRLAERPTVNAAVEPFRVAIVGAGPSGFYVAQALLASAPGPVEISMFDKLPTPFGLVRSGVAPDHPNTKKVTDLFRWVAAHPDVHSFYNVEIGTHISHDELRTRHHAVVYTVGAATARNLDIPGENLPGSYSATDFVAWYNGHPDHADLPVELSGTRAVIIGNGNVALDIARILLRNVDDLVETDIADHALAALAESSIQEVVLLGRRDLTGAAYTTPELLGLDSLDDVDVVVDPRDRNEHLEPNSLETDELDQLISRTNGSKRLVLRFLTSPLEITGTDRVRGLRVGRNRIVVADGTAVVEQTGRTETIETTLVVRAIGYRGQRLPGLPFDERSGTIPNHQGRVVDPATGEAVIGVYTSGWIKRGASGAIGTNRADAAETVSALLEDHRNAKLSKPTVTPSDFRALVRERQPHRFDRQHWQRLDEHELELGLSRGRPRQKVTDRDAMIRIADLWQRPAPRIDHMIGGA
ncbi:4Fe-4S binding protein [Nocardia alba]|uniref:Ferredoxin--NADP+ reductase n=1 Tax=Nocardia alba TaxID=225051 RepID=A0A4V2PBJ5_9NOCA|nr:4Fe-4S binding protein [Nocardia alba]TCJ97655.1 ferredoxin--NADP+ reductase [Nocardia alba]